MDEWSKKLGDRLKEYSYDKSVDEDKVQAFFDRREAMQQPQRSRSRSWMMIAASLVFLFLAGIGVFYSNNMTLQTAAGEVASLKLPDGSRVELAYESEISYNKLSWIWSREVALEGEAYFEVEKGSRFSVVSDQGTTSVLGTKFNVYASEGSYTVECFEGKVKVEVNEFTAQLEAGDGVDFRKRKPPRKYETRRNNPGWKEGELFFNGQDILIVLEELERVYGIEIVGKKKVSSQEYNGYFPTDNLDVALKLALDPVGARYEQKGLIVTIK